MSPLLYLACAWPGLPALWLRGRWSGLGWALLFSTVLNTALLATFVWPEWLSWAMTTTLWIAAGSLCVLGYWQSLTQLPKLLGTTTDPQADQKLVDAQCAYLQGQYYEAEQGLRRLLHLQPDDPEARLLLASVYRRTNRKKEALDALKRLAEAPRGGRWLFEATRLRAAIQEMSDEPATPEPEASSTPRVPSLVEEASIEPQPVSSVASTPPVDEEQPSAERATVTAEARSRAA